MSTVHLVELVLLAAVVAWLAIGVLVALLFGRMAGDTDDDALAHR